MAYIEQSLEACIAAEIDAVIDVPVIYRNQQREEVTPDKPSSYVEVKASPRRKRSTNSPICDIAVEVTVVADQGQCADADYCVALCDPVISLLDNWTSDLDTACDTVTVDTFRVDGISWEGGESPAYDSGNKVWYSTFQLTISGVIQTPVEE